MECTARPMAVPASASVGGSVRDSGDYGVFPQVHPMGSTSTPCHGLPPNNMVANCEPCNSRIQCLSTNKVSIVACMNAIVLLFLKGFLVQSQLP